MVLSLDSFSTELLLKIFKYLDIRDLCRLKQTCTRFNEIIEKWGNLLNKNVKPLVTNQTHSSIINRSNRTLPLLERIRISRNWRLGIYNEKMLLHTKAKYIPWLHLEKGILWISRGSSIQGYKRHSRGIYTNSASYSIRGGQEICRFVKKNHLVLSGHIDGSMQLWSMKDHKFVFRLKNCHDADINSVDMTDEVIVSGSGDNLVKIWPRRDENVHRSLCQSIELGDRVWSVSLSEEKPLVAIGTSGISYISTLTVFDIVSQTPLIKFNPKMCGAGVLDIKWESPSTLWSCGYDTNVRRWDLRTRKCEQVLSDPFGATIYCFEYDYFNTIISGTQSNGRAVLWDTRQNNYVQMYFMDSCQRRDRSSPVYSLSFDGEFLFTVTDQYVNVLDFSVLKGTSKDYGNLFLKQIKV